MLKVFPNISLKAIQDFIMESVQCVLQNVADIKKLKSSGICTIKGIQMCTRKRLCNIKGFSEAKVDKIKEACGKLAADSFLTALQFSFKRKNVFRVATGSDEVE